jgi:hypothetical protein
MSAVERTAKYLRAHRRRWVSAIDLARVGGLLAWRTEVSRCRSIFGMTIENRLERHPGGKVRSYYRYSGLRKAES